MLIGRYYTFADEFQAILHRSSTPATTKTTER